LDGERLEEVVDLAFLVEWLRPDMGAIYDHFKREDNDEPLEFALPRLEGKMKRTPVYFMAKSVAAIFLSTNPAYMEP
jgi:hypothetical protein